MDKDLKEYLMCTPDFENDGEFLNALSGKLTRLGYGGNYQQPTFDCDKFLKAFNVFLSSQLSQYMLEYKYSELCCHRLKDDPNSYHIFFHKFHIENRMLFTIKESVVGEFSLSIKNRNSVRKKFHIDIPIGLAYDINYLTTSIVEFYSSQATEAAVEPPLAVVML